MKQGRRRWLAIAACYWLQQILPVQLRPWGLAVRNEVSEIDDDSRALLFAMDSLWGLALQAMLIHIRHYATHLRSGATTRRDSIMTGLVRTITNRPRALGIICALVAVLLGLAYMTLATAPMQYMLVNAVALVIALLFIAIADRIAPAPGRSRGIITVALATALLATALAGVQIGGAARWVDLGFVHIQPSLVLLPFMIVSFACHRDKLSVIGLLLASLALALQPDRAMSGMLLAGMAAITIFRFDRLALAALIGSSIGFMATLAQADTLPAVPFVDQIFYSSFDAGLIAGLCVIAGTMLLIVPAVLGFAYDADHREVYAASGVLWTAAIAAAAIGNYPTPVVGYSGGAILGYVLSLMLLPKTVRKVARHHSDAQGNATEAVRDEPTMRLSHA